nr:hypothetical protein [Candidatus Sigynarchaeota archaeon]
KKPLQTGIIIIDPTHLEVVNIWLETLAQLQVAENDLFTMLPPDSFETDMFESKLLKFMKERGIDAGRFPTNVSVISFIEPHIASNVKPYVRTLTKADDLLGLQDSDDIIAKTTERVSKFFLKQKRTGRIIMFVYLPTFLSRLNNPKDFLKMIMKIIPGLGQNVMSILLAMIPSGDPLIPDLLRIVDLVIDTSFVSGSPVMNFLSPQLPYTFGFLKKEDGNVNGIKLDMFPII